MYASNKLPYNIAFGAFSLSHVRVVSAEVETTTPVAPLVPPVTVSPTVNVPVGIITTNCVAEVIELIVVLSALVPPVIVSPETKVPLTLLTVSVNLLSAKLIGL